MALDRDRGALMPGFAGDDPIMEGGLYGGDMGIIVTGVIARGPFSCAAGEVGLCTGVAAGVIGLHTGL